MAFEEQIKHPSEAHSSASLPTYNQIFLSINPSSFPVKPSIQHPCLTLNPAKLSIPHSITPGTQMITPFEHLIKHPHQTLNLVSLLDTPYRIPVKHSTPVHCLIQCPCQTLFKDTPIKHAMQHTQVTMNVVFRLNTRSTKPSGRPNSASLSTD